MQADLPGLLAAASAAIQAGQLGQAEALCRQCLSFQPANGGAKLVLAHIRRRVGDFDGAVKLAEEAGRKMPKDPAPRLEAALAHLAAGRLAQAESAARKALRVRPGFVPALLGLTEVLKLAGKPEQALVEARRAAALAPEIYEARLAHANALFDAQRFEDASAEFEAAGRLRPELTDPLYNRARALFNLERFGAAEPLMQQCLEREPGAIDVYGNLVAIYGEQNRFDELFALCDLGIARCAQPAPLWQIKAAWRLILGDTQESLACHARALATTPADDASPSAQTRFARALALLTVGCYAEGWREMRWRPGRAVLAQRYPDLAADPSSLPQDLSGQRVLVVQEQGLGDELFFLRYVPRLQARGARVVYLGEPKMHAILAARQGFFEQLLLPEGASPRSGSGPQAIAREIDWTLLSGDLPEAAGGDIAPPLSLEPDPKLLAAWSQRLAALGPPPYIGVTWRAGLAPDLSFRFRTARLVKQLPPEFLAVALKEVPGTVLVLQRDPAPAELEGFSRALGRQAHDLSGLNERLDEMLVLLRLLREYVGVSNANLHLGASVGLKSRVMLMRMPEWRWAAAGDASPWFPGSRLYRQQIDGGWATPFERLRKDLLEDAARRS